MGAAKVDVSEMSTLGLTKADEGRARLAFRLAAVRRKLTSVGCGTGLGWAISLGAGALLAGMAADWLLDLPRWIRAVLLTIDFLAVAHVLYHYVYRPSVDQPDDDAVALMVEVARPIFETRLIASIQLAGSVPDGTSGVLIDSLVKETEKLSDVSDLDGVIRTGRFWKSVSAAAMTLALGAGLFGWLGEDAKDLLKRAFLADIPVPRQTRVMVDQLDLRVARGEDVTLRARAEGVIPSLGQLNVKFESGRAGEFSLEPSAGGNAVFEKTFTGVQDSFKFIFRLNDGRSREGKVTVVPRPAVRSVNCRQVFPKYTGLETTTRALGDLALLAGSELHLDIEPNKAVKSGAIRLYGLPEGAPNEVALRLREGNKLAGALSITNLALSGFSVHLMDSDGFTSRDEAIYRVDVLPDRAPQVRITYPERKEEMVTQRARLPVGFEVTDDFGFSRIEFRFSVEGGPVQSRDLQLPENASVLRNHYEWRLDTIKPAVPLGSYVEYWIVVTDNNNVTGPSIGESAHYLAKVVSDAEKRADLLNRAGDFLGSIGEAAGDQEKLNQRLGKLIREKAEQK